MIRPRAGMSLVETVVAIAVLGIIGAVSLPLLYASGETYAAARTARIATDHAAFALDRALRLLRDVPGDTEAGTVELALAESDRVHFLDGRGLEFHQETLWLRTTDETLAPLLRNVTNVAFRYLDHDGVTLMHAELSKTHRFEIRLTCSGLTLHGTAFARVRMLTPEAP
ncbi:MAG: type II secretion system protein [Phycisphaeraceae bacterium]|nr:type II secretion system protein [Phycisphaeraceae bacterium]